MSENETHVVHKCFRCEKSVTEEDLREGRAYKRDDHYVCPDCLDDIKRNAAAGDPGAVRTALAEMAGDLRNISQHIRYEQFSWMYLLGAVIQVVVFYLLYRAHVAETVDKAPLLLWAIVVQLICMTAFIVGKLK
jgi:hypothetical protein